MHKITAGNNTESASDRAIFPTISTLTGSVCLCIALSACTGGSGGNTTLTSDEQSPDPVVLEIPVAYIKRPLPEEPGDLRDPLAFNPGAELLVRDRSSASAEDLDITHQIAAIVSEEEGVSASEIAIDIRGLESSFDGKTLIFAARAVPEPVDTNLELTTWNLWTLDLESMQADYLIPSRIKRNEGMETGGGHDTAPHFLTDDRIIFSSTRQVASQSRALNEGRNQIFAALDESQDDPATVLHVYDPRQRDAEFKQISHNLSHDLDPAVLANGDIVFSRWNNTATNHISLFRMSPKGFRMSPLYGFDSQDQGTEGTRIEYTQPRELEDGRIVALTQSFSSETLGGEIVIIDAANYADYDQPLWENPGAPGPGHESLTDTEVRTDGLLSTGGQFGSVYPLYDGSGRLLVTWSDCRVIDEEDQSPDTVEPGDHQPCSLQPNNEDSAPPLFGAWIYSPTDNTQQPVVIPTEGMLISEIIAAEPRNYPEISVEPENFDADLAIENKGRLLIDSVYDYDGIDQSPQGIAQHARPGTDAFIQRPARFLRILQPVPIPDPEVYEIPRYASGVASSFREIAGYVPIEPDGSVTVNVAADRPFSFQVLDVKGRRTSSTHNYWLQVAPGEVLHCTGCHGNTELPHGRADSQPEVAGPGARALSDGTIGFPGTDSDDLFAIETGQSMAQVWNLHRPKGNAFAAARELSLTPLYTDEWSHTTEPDADILDRAYDPAWLDIPTDKPLVVANLDPTQQPRIVINYVDHIQPIWDRTRDPVADIEGNLIETCTGCHQNAEGTAVPAGQLDLSSTPSADEANHYTSYRELLVSNAEQWLTEDGAIGDRTRLCTTIDADGNTLTSSQTVVIGSRLRSGYANGSGRFFDCFEGDRCGPPAAPALPDNCTEDGGIIVPATNNTVDHTGMLSEPELRLLSEWIDIGAQYYNNPFDERLAN